MPGTLTITVKYPNGDIETFTNCIEADASTDDNLDFTGSIQTTPPGPASERHKIKVGPGMRVSRKTA